MADRLSSRLGFSRSGIPAYEPEAAAATRLAVGADQSAHQLDELLADREAEAGSAIAARRRAVGLDEAGEQRIAQAGPSNRSSI